MVGIQRKVLEVLEGRPMMPTTIEQVSHLTRFRTGQVTSALARLAQSVDYPVRRVGGGVYKYTPFGAETAKVPMDLVVPPDDSSDTPPMRPGEFVPTKGTLLLVSEVLNGGNRLILEDETEALTVWVKA